MSTKAKEEIEWMYKRYLILLIEAYESGITVAILARRMYVTEAKVESLLEKARAL